MQIMKDKKLFKQIDAPLLVAAVLITFYGIMNIYSATYAKSGFSYFFLQSLWLLVSLGILGFILCIDFRIICNYAGLIYWAGVVLLLYNDITSKAVKGASSWIRIGSRAIEPGEFVKIGMILMLAKKVEDMEGNINNVKNLCILAVYAFIPMFLIMIQPNLGMTIICFCIALGILFIVDLDIKVILWGVVSLIPFSLLIWFSGLLKTYQKERILSFLNPGSAQQDSAYQLTQSIIGIGSGGLWGKGFLHGTQVSGGYIPEVHTDFIFAVVGEEWGLIGAACLLLLYGILIYRMIKLAKESSSFMGRVICIGTASAFIFSIFQNIGMTIGLMPIAGITLPLMSYGGSSLMTSFISIALVLNAGMRKQKLIF